MKTEIEERVLSLTKEIYNKGYKEGYKEGFEQGLKESGWIMCDDELPVSDDDSIESDERNKQYLTISEFGIYSVLPYWHGWNRFKGSSDKHELKNIVAWKPLPSPITESEEEHE